MKPLALAVLLMEALILTACSPSAGTSVEIKPGSIGCRIWSDPNLSWLQCSQVENGSVGIVEDRPNGLGHEYMGRIRVNTQAFGPLWFEPGDIKVS